MRYAVVPCLSYSFASGEWCLISDYDIKCYRVPRSSLHWALSLKLQMLLARLLPALLQSAVEGQG